MLITSRGMHTMGLKVSTMSLHNFITISPLAVCMFHAKDKSFRESFTAHSICPHVFHESSAYLSASTKPPASGENDVVKSLRAAK